MGCLLRGNQQDKEEVLQADFPIYPLRNPFCQSDLDLSKKMLIRCPVCNKGFISHGALRSHRSLKRPKTDGTRLPNPCLMSEEEIKQYKAEAHQRRLQNSRNYMRQKREKQRIASGKEKRKVYTPEERKAAKAKSSKKWVQKNPEKIAVYRKRFQDKHNQWVKENPEKVAAYHQTYRRKHRWKISARKRLPKSQYQQIIQIEDRPTVPLEMTMASYSRPDLYGKPVSPREFKVLAEVAVHGSNRIAADCIGISEQTVKNHLSAAYCKLGVGAITSALEVLGWLRIPEIIPVHKEVA